MRLPRKFITHCILCTRRIPQRRQRRNAITCTPLHQKMLTALRKRERDNRLCQQCGKPCTPQEKIRFRQWRTENASRDRLWPRKNRHAQKDILDSAMAIKKIADVCPEPSRKPKKERRTAA